ncbi:conserved threonine rich protein [Mycobacterium lepromatosis]|nr:conserved threonine rich protein [Mycobacterium lepromatosis]
MLPGKALWPAATDGHSPAGSSTKIANSTTTTTSVGAPPTAGITDEPATSSVKIRNTMHYGSFGTTATLNCGDDKSLNLAGSSNTLTGNGVCATVTIIGGKRTRSPSTRSTKNPSLLGLDNTDLDKKRRPEGKQHRLRQRHQQRVG